MNFAPSPVSPRILLVLALVRNSDRAGAGKAKLAAVAVADRMLTNTERITWFEWRGARGARQRAQPMITEGSFLCLLRCSVSVSHSMYARNQSARFSVPRKISELLDATHSRYCQILPASKPLAYLVRPAPRHRYDNMGHGRVRKGAACRFCTVRGGTRVEAQGFISSCQQYRC